MDLRYTPEEIAFRDELRTIFRSKIPAAIRKKISDGHHLTRDEIVESHRILHAEGLATPNWPVEWGGKDWSPVQRYIYNEEVLANAVPMPLSFNVAMVGPVIANFGSQAQKEKFLPKTASLDIWWAQGFSEPGAGSDLASLKTSAKREGDHYIVNGQKTWTTLGQYADWIFLLVRTDPAAKKQQGISFLLVDMKTPRHHRAPDHHHRRRA
ncbi:acyl-CoA dehydrogenase family protein [Pseudoroseomonas cervicalis]|uniref:acyl-CoA dehydrogenase family protein n=1 Tax=Teichococcus cervicalis TaxID=204525 RepID=UPI0035EFBB20